MAFNPELGSTSPAVLLDNAERLDKLVNGPAADVPDRGGDPLYSWRQMMAKNDEVRQNLIPLSKQYQTLAAAQADIANIPDGSTTYYRSPDDSALAIEVMNVGGTLTATGREMPSQQTVINVNTALRELIDELPNDVLFLFSDSDGFRIADIALDQTGKPVLSLGRLSLSRNSDSVFDI
ncbi:TPA: flagellar biosynthesis protein, partial [Klebsiella pneumoniae]